MAIKLPVYTNFPTDKTVLRGTDSLLLAQIKQINRCLTKDSFWLAQVAQVNITPAGTFELVPVVGNHVVVFGDGNNCEAKLRRLWLFYQQVAANIGFDRYSVVNVQYEKQVVATKKGTISKVDSLQALKNIQKLIEASHKLPGDTVSTMVDNNIMVSAQADTTLTVLANDLKTVTKPTVKEKPKDIKHVPTTTNPSSLKNRAPFPLKKQPVKPKAVMKG
jgi:cell division protein FtsQ